MTTRSDPATPEGARPVREEDAFDVPAVAAWLREHADPELGAELDGTPEVRQFSGGASNLTYLLRYPTRDLILRRAPRGTKAKGAHDMGREFRIQHQLKPVFPYVPAMVGFCEDDRVIGADFYVMERVDGIVPRGDMAGDSLTPEQARQLCLNMIDVLVELHSVDPVEAGLAALGKGAGYVGRQVGGWSARYRNARTDDAPAFEEAMAWLAENQPDDVRTCVIHNDFKMDNLVFDRADPTRVVGVLDWEMATLGDPLMDLGGDLAFWVEADDDEEFQLFRRVPTHLPGMISRAEFVERYCARMGIGLTPEQWRFYEIFGLFRLAVISQQIYYRYFHKQTSNELFALFGPAVHIAERRIRRLLGWE
jgi:aminoglycoside phosphotransferase (APT) family kinase protein